MNTKVKLTEDNLQDIWSALSYFIRECPDEGTKVTKCAMKKIINKIRGVKNRKDAK